MAKKYIEADALIKSLATETGCMDRFFHAMDVADMVKNFPAADVRENVHGEWLYQELIPNDITGTMHGECNVCHKVRIIDKFRPNCGADMRKKGEE